MALVAKQFTVTLSRRSIGAEGANSR